MHHHRSAWETETDILGSGLYLFLLLFLGFLVLGYTVGSGLCF